MASSRPGLGVGREVNLPPGPLHRVEGTAVAIPCSVAEYEGPTLQHFEWFVYRPSAPDISIGVVSTRDPKFPYAIFRARVQAGNVSIHRVRGDAVELRIRPLRAEDGGVYECYTPTTDSKYHGSYSGKVELRGTPGFGEWGWAAWGKGGQAPGWVCVSWLAGQSKAWENSLFP